MKYLKKFIPFLAFLIIPRIEAAFDKIIIEAEGTPMLEINARYDASPKRNIVPSAIVVKSLLPDKRMIRHGRNTFVRILGRFAQSLSYSGAVTMTSNNEYDTNFILSFDSAPSLFLDTPNIDMMDWQVVFSGLNQHNLLEGNGIGIPSVHPLQLFFSSNFLDYVSQHILGNHINYQKILVPLRSFLGHTTNRLSEGLVFTQSSDENNLIININKEEEGQIFSDELFLKDRFFCSMKSFW